MIWQDLTAAEGWRAPLDVSLFKLRAEIKLMGSSSTCDAHQVKRMKLLIDKAKKSGDMMLGAVIAARIALQATFEDPSTRAVVVESGAKRGAEQSPAFDEHLAKKRAVSEHCESDEVITIQAAD